MNLEPHANKVGPKRKKRKYRIVGGSNAPVVEPSLERFSKSRHELIAEVAYYKAERRGFRGGDPDRDWQEAEMEIEELLRKGRPS